LKPDNLFLCRVPGSTGAGDQEVCKVLDFGIAKWSRDDDEMPMDQLETQAGTVFGTPRYMSPEQAQGSPLDARSDLYSLGVLLYQMLSGRAPFVDDDAVVVMARHIKDEPLHFQDMTPKVFVPESIEAMVWRVLAKSPADRPSSAEELIGELDAAEASVRAQESGPRLTLAGRERAPVSRRALLLFGAAFLALLLGAGALLKKRASPVANPESGTSTGAQPLLVESRGPESAPLVSVSSLENSSATPPAPAPAGASSAALIKHTHTHSGAKPALQKKGNERYGRFD
jgi:serine/threonine protein kinase